MEGYPGMVAREDEIPDAGKVRMLEAIDRLILLYSARDDSDGMRKWQLEKASRETAISVQPL